MLYYAIIALPMFAVALAIYLLNKAINKNMALLDEEANAVFINSLQDEPPLRGFDYDKD